MPNEVRPTARRSSLAVRTVVVTEVRGGLQPQLGHGSTSCASARAAKTSKARSAVAARVQFSVIEIEIRIVFPTTAPPQRHRNRRQRPTFVIARMAWRIPRGVLNWFKTRLFCEMNTCGDSNSNFPIGTGMRPAGRLRK